MDNKIKNSLGAIGVIAIAILAYAGFIYARAYSESIQPSSFRNFAVSGEGKVTTIPDIAKFSFSVITQGGKDIVAAQDENTKKVNAIIGFIKAKGVDAKDIMTQQFSIDPRYQYYDCSRIMTQSSGTAPRPCPPPDIVGYTVTQTAMVTVRDFAKIGDILSGASQQGANSISQLSFTIDDPIKSEKEARQKAIEQAQDKARAVAQTGNFSIGKLLSIEESGYMPTPMYGIGGMAKMSFADSAAPVAPSVEPGSQEIKVSVTLRYEIK